MPKKLSLKPIEAQLKKIQAELELRSKKAKGTKQLEIKKEIKKIEALIVKVPPACKANTYNVG